MDTKYFSTTSHSFEISPPNFNELYLDIDTLGYGSFGIVSLVKDKKNRLFAMKKIKFREDEEGLSTAVLREISLLREFDHRNIVKLIGIDYSWKGKYNFNFLKKLYKKNTFKNDLISRKRIIYGI